MPRDDGRRPLRRRAGTTAPQKAVSELPEEIVRAASDAASSKRPAAGGRRAGGAQVKDRIIARLKRLHPMD